jgi:membrane protein
VRTILTNSASSLLGNIRRGICSTIHVFWTATYAFFHEEALDRASSLAFATLLSIVPLLTVVLMIMNFYGISADAQKEMELALAQYILPSQSRDVVSFVVSTASDVTQNVGFFGLIGFGVTLILMARELERHVLTICHRKAIWWRSIMRTIAFVILAPTGMVLAFLVMHPLSAVLALLPTWWSHVNYPFLLAELVVVILLRSFSDNVLSWRACTIGAIAAGLAAGVSWKGYIWYLEHSASLPAYGALSCIPAFMLWVYLAWCCMLYGVQVAAKTQTVLTGDCCRERGFGSKILSTS